MKHIKIMFVLTSIVQGMPLHAMEELQHNKVKMPASLFDICVKKLTVEQLAYLIGVKNAYEDSAIGNLDLETLLIEKIKHPHARNSFVNNSLYLNALQLPKDVEKRVVCSLIKSNDLKDRLQQLVIPTCPFKVQKNYSSLSLSPNGAYLAVGTRNGNIYIWDITAKTCVHTLSEHTNTVNAVSWSSDNIYLASAADQMVYIWQIKQPTCKRVKMLKYDSKIGTVSWNKKGTFLVCGAAHSGELYLWNVATQKYDMLIGHVGRIKAASWSPDDNYIASGSDDLTVRIWNTKDLTCKILQEKNEVAAMSPFAHGASSIVWSCDGTRIITASDFCTVYEWDVVECKSIRTKNGYRNWVKSACLSNDGHYLASGEDDGNIHIADIDTEINLYLLQGYSGWVDSVIWGVHCNYIISGAQDGTIYLWDIRDIKTLQIPTLKQALLLELLQNVQIEAIKPYSHLCLIFNTLAPFVKQTLDPNYVIPVQLVCILNAGKARGIGAPVPLLSLGDKPVSGYSGDKQKEPVPSTKSKKHCSVLKKVAGGIFYCASLYGALRHYAFTKNLKIPFISD